MFIIFLNRKAFLYVQGKASFKRSSKADHGWRKGLAKEGPHQKAENASGGSKRTYATCVFVHARKQRTRIKRVREKRGLKGVLSVRRKCQFRVAAASKRQGMYAAPFFSSPEFSLRYEDKISACCIISPRHLHVNFSFK